MQIQCKGSFLSVSVHFCVKYFLQVFKIISRNVSSTRRELHELQSRGLVQLRGKDVVPFLQGLVTNDVESLGPKLPAQFAMLLNVQVQ